MSHLAQSPHTTRRPHDVKLEAVSIISVSEVSQPRVVDFVVHLLIPLIGGHTMSQLVCHCYRSVQLVKGHIMSCY